jgi:hypothetical protein
VDPVTIAALLGLAGKALDAGVGAWRSWLETGKGVAIAADGSQHRLPTGGQYGGPRLIEPGFLGRGAPVPFDAAFVPADQWATQLFVEQPILVVIEDLDELSPLDSVIAAGSLGDPFEGSLFPSNYLLGAFVFYEADPRDWEDVAGGALVEFSVTSGEPPFQLEIPIESLSVPGEVLQGWGSLSAGQQDHYDVTFEGDITYHIYVAPVDPRADFDLYVFDENENLIDSDDDVDSDALCVVTPRWTGPFDIVVACDSGVSSYGLFVES